MEVTAALLCDYAQVREGLLFVSSGGITRTVVEQVPGPVRLSVALMLELEPSEVELVHEVRVTLAHEGHDLMGVVHAFQPVVEGLEPGESLQLPLPLQLNFPAPEVGPYDVRVSADGAPPRLLRFYVVERPKG